MELPFCWEVIKCGKEETCPAYYDQENVCYKQLDMFLLTFCPCGNRRTKKTPYPSCSGCTFYESDILRSMYIFCFNQRSSP